MPPNCKFELDDAPQVPMFLPSSPRGFRRTCNCESFARRDLASYLHTSRSQIEDCTQEWTFPDNSFDYIHIRLLVGSIADWGALFKEAYRCLAPGGWIESHEGSPNLHSDNEPIPTTTAMGQWGPLFVSGGRVMGRSFTVVEDETQRKAIEEAGFVSIGEKKTTVCSALREGRTFC